MSHCFINIYASTSYLQTKCLEELDARNTTLNEQYMPILSKALRLSTQLHILKLENCNLSGRPLVILGKYSKFLSNSGYSSNLRFLLPIVLGPILWLHPRGARGGGSKNLLLSSNVSHCKSVINRIRLQFSLISLTKI